MVITCERCSTSYVLKDELVSASGTSVQCTRCQHLFLATRDGSPPVHKLITCPQCTTVFQLARGQASEGVAVQCARCSHVFQVAGPTTNGPRPFVSPPFRVPAPGPTPPRRNVMLFGGPRDAESYRSAVGRMTFGLVPPTAQPESTETMLFETGPEALVKCHKCSTELRLVKAQMPTEGVACTTCGHTFRWLPSPADGVSHAPAPPRFAPVPPWHAGPGPLPRRNVMIFGEPRRDVNALPTPSEPPAESHPRTDRVMFFTPAPPEPPRQTMVFSASGESVVATPAEKRSMVFGTIEVVVTCPQCSARLLVRRDQLPAEFVVARCTNCGRASQAGNLGDSKKPATPPEPVDPLDRMLTHAADHLDDEQALLVLSDALMERGDPRGRLIAFMLEEERQSDLMRKVKVNVLTRDHAAQWAPPGARITGFHRGLPADLEWSGPTDPHHLAWRSARSLHVTLGRVPKPSFFDVPRPNLRRVSGLNRAFFTHVAAIAPAGLEAIDGQVHTDELLNDAARTLTRMPRLQFATLRSTRQLLDGRLREQHLRSFLEAAGRSSLKGVRLSMPQLPLAVIDSCLAAAPRLSVQFVIPFEDFSRPITLGVDPRRRLFLTPAGMFVDFRLRQVCDDLSAMLGETLSIVQSKADR